MSAGHGNLTSAREAAAILAAVERYWPLRTRSLRTRSLRTRSLLPWKLSGELLSGKLGPGTERPVVWLSGEGSIARAAGAGLRCPGLSYAQLAVAQGVISYVWQHPANRGQRHQSLIRVARYQARSRLLRGPCARAIAEEGRRWGTKAASGSANSRSTQKVR